MRRIVRGLSLAFCWLLLAAQSVPAQDGAGSKPVPVADAPTSSPPAAEEAQDAKGPREDGGYPLSEESFRRFRPYFSETVQGPYRVDMEEAPALDCIGMPNYKDANLRGDEVPDASGLTVGAIDEALAAFSGGRYDESVALLKPGVVRRDPASHFALGCVMEGLARARFDGPAALRRAMTPEREAVERGIAASRVVDGQVRTALDWLKAAAEAGYRPAQWELARRWSMRHEVRYSAFLSIEWVRRLAAGGDARAQALLGGFYRRGFLVPRDLEEAGRLITLSANAGDRIGMMLLADMFYSGDIGRKDDAASYEWQRRLAVAGDAEGQFQTGVALLEGEGVARDPVPAAAWLRKAADQGHAAAANELAVLLRSGDATLAAAYETKAISLGDCFALLDAGEKRLRAGSISAQSPGLETVLDPLNRCASTPYFSYKGPLEGRGLHGPARQDFDGRLNTLRVALGYGRRDRTPVFRQLTAADPAVARQGVDSLIALARALIAENDGGPRAADRDGAEEALAVLAFPAAWLPASTREMIDSAAWRQAFDRLRPGLRASVADHILSSRLTRQDMGAVLAVYRAVDRQNGSERPRSETQFLSGIGLQPAAFNLILKRLDQGVDPGEVSTDLFLLTHTCTLTRAYSDWVSRMTAHTGDCGGLAALSSLSVAQLKRLADLGLGEAKMFLAMAYVDGEGVAADPAQAIEILTGLGPFILPRAAMAGLYEDGRGVDPDTAKAAAIYSEYMSSEYLPELLFWEAGVATVAARSGRLLIEGDGVQRDPVRGVELLRIGVQYGVSRAAVSLGDALILGSGAPQDQLEGLRWYRQVGPSDHLAYVRFGFLAATGRWNERSLGARRWYALAGQSDDPLVFLDLARAAAYEDRPRIADVRRWLSLAAARNNRWALMWLRACPKGGGECFKRQPGFGRPFFADIGAAWTPTLRPADKPDPQQSTAILAADTAHIQERVRGAIAAGEPRQVIEPLLHEMETVQSYHGDTDGAVATRLRLLVVKDAALQSKYGNIRNYFAAVDSSCHWGMASKMAYGLGRKETALLFAKVAVNRLQQARSYLAGLEGDVRECFVDVHKDRYRWLADLLIETGRLPEAETVLGMLKDFEVASYTGDHSRRGAGAASLAYSSQEAVVVEQVEAFTSTLLTAAVDSDEEGGGRAAVGVEEAADENFQDFLDTLTAKVGALDAVASDRPSASRAEWLQSVDRSIVTDLRRRFPSGTATLHAVVLPDRMHWLLTSRGGRRSITIMLREEDLNAAIVDLRSDILTRSPHVTESARKLYDMIYAPVDAELRRQRVATVMLSLDRRLRYVPFAALHDGKGWLVERYSFSAFRRPDDYLRTPRGPPYTIAGFAATGSKDPGMAPLPGAGEEVAAIVRTGDTDAGVIDGVERIDGAFTRAAFVETLSRDFRIVHIASHFVLDPTSADGSYLLLGDGSRLPLLEFRRDGRFTFAFADLVTLSACQTALGGKFGDGSEIDSMAAIAQDAGAPAVVASLWSVPDSSTAELMVRFYALRAEGDMSLSDAMRQAQLALLHENRTDTGDEAADGLSGNSHPYFWAAFTVMGNWQ